MIYISGSNGLIGRELCKSIAKWIPISYRNEVPQIDFLPNSILIHLSSSTTPRDSFEELQQLFQSNVLIPFRLFENYLKANPNGRIIFLSSAGDLHSSDCHDKISNEDTIAIPKSIYGTHKLLLENYIKQLHERYTFSSAIFRTTNVYGGKIDQNRVNGLIDKLILSTKHNTQITITSNCKTTINLIHISDLNDLILKSLEADLRGFNLFLVGGLSSISIEDVINKIQVHKPLNLIYKNENSKPSYINIDTTKAQKYFNWKCKSTIDDDIIKLLKSI